MAQQFREKPGDAADFSSCLLRLLTFPVRLSERLRQERGLITKDLGIRTVTRYILSTKVLERLSHVPNSHKQAKAVSRLVTVLVGGTTKRRRSVRGTKARTETRDRVISYIERCILTYLSGDLEKAFGQESVVTELYDDVCSGDDLLKDIFSVVSDAPSLRHVLPISILSFVCLLVEMMQFGEVRSVEGADQDNVLDFQRGDLYRGLECVSLRLLSNIHSGSGIVPGGDGRPSFSGTYVHGRDGELSKIALSNFALAAALCLGGRVRVPVSAMSKVRNTESDNFNLDLGTFYPFLRDLAVFKKEERREYYSGMQEACDFLSNARGMTLSGELHLKPFFETYEALQKGNKVTATCFRGRGVLFECRFVPDVVRCRQNAGNEGTSPLRDAVLKEINDDIRSFRRMKDSCLDSEREVDLKGAKKVKRFSFPISKDLCSFLYACMRLSESVEKIIRKRVCRRGVESSSLETMKDLEEFLSRQLVLGLFACDLTGNISRLYEDYIYAALMRHFDEQEGLPCELKAADKRRQFIRKKKKLRTDEVESSNENLNETTKIQKCDFIMEDEDWAPM